MQSPLSLNLCPHIAEISPAEWNACAGADNPFVSHGFLSALEESGSAGERTGWAPRHLVLRQNDGTIAAVVPMYVKSHSYGEYVFDSGWAQAFDQAGGRYYPKLQVAVPFSPVPGPRLLRNPLVDIDTATLADVLRDLCKEMKTSSVHVTFCSQQEWKELGEAGWLQRTGTQFHWHNQGYKSFDDFLLRFASRKRKNVKKERRLAHDQGLTFVTRRGSEITEAHWDAFFQFYQATVDRKWGQAYLSRTFFSLLAKRLQDKVVLITAELDGKPIAGALNLIGGDTLFGRNWGAVGDWPFLHFELCYYQAIEFAISLGLKHVEAGAQGEHKIQRGYLPQRTYSAHWIAHEGLSDAVARYLVGERQMIEEEIELLAAASPYRLSDETED